MQCRPLLIAGAWELSPERHHDDRGLFMEALGRVSLEKSIGSDLCIAQVNMSVSRRGVIRGVHLVRWPPGQAKYVMCVAGEILDVIVDLRSQSPCFGQWDAVVLDDVSRHSVFLTEGLGHAFQVLSQSATVVYATSSPYDPNLEITVHPLDPQLAIPWRDLGQPILSRRDSNAPLLEEVARRLIHLDE